MKNSRNPKKYTKNQNSLLIIVSICLLVISVLVLFCRAVNQAGMPMHGVNLLQNQDVDDPPGVPEVFLGNQRSDIVVCYRDPATQTLLLWNLTYQQFDDQPEIYPAELLESYGMLPGDFAQIIYTAEYTDYNNNYNIYNNLNNLDNPENPACFQIRDLQDWTQLTPSEALTLADPAVNQNHSADFPVQVWDSQDTGISQNIRYLMIPADGNYLLFQSDSDDFRQFDDYKCISQSLEFPENSDNPDNSGILNNWVLCRGDLTDEAIRERLQQGIVTTTADNNLFFVGYENPEIFDAFPHSILTVESDEVRNWHLTAKQLAIPEILEDLPEAVRQELSRNWNQTDDIIIFAGNLTTDTIPGFDQDHRLIPIRGTGEPAGYAVWYLPTAFFEQVCPGVAE